MIERKRTGKGKRKTDKRWAYLCTLFTIFKPGLLRIRARDSVILSALCHSLLISRSHDYMHFKLCAQLCLTWNYVSYNVLSWFWFGIWITVEIWIERQTPYTGNSRNALAAMNANFKRLFIAFPIVCRLFVMVFIAIGVVCLFATWKIKMSYRLFAACFFSARFVHNCVYLECKWMIMLYIIFFFLHQFSFITYSVVIVWMHRLCWSHPHTPVAQIVWMSHSNCDSALRI